MRRASLSPRLPLLLLALALAASSVLFVHDAPSASASHEVLTPWSASLTFADITPSGNAGVGCSDADGASAAYACARSDVLSKNTFKFRGVDYRVETIWFNDGDGTATLTFDKNVPEDFDLLTFHNGIEQNSLADATKNGASVTVSLHQAPGLGAVGFTTALKLTFTPEHAGDLDPDFGLGGKLTTSFSSAASEIHDIVEQSDDKIVAVGFTHNGTDKDFALARYNPDGSLDSSFGTGGRVVTDFGSGDDEARAVALQSDGKIVVAGYASVSGAYDFAAARYDTDGSLDTTFDTDGKLTTNMGATDIAHAVAVHHSNGKIVLAGQAGNSFGVARYTAAGAPDTTFDTDGKQTTSFTAGVADVAHAVAILSDGKIVVAGYATNNNGTTDTTDDDQGDFALARYTMAGALDTTFDTDGKVTTNIATTAGGTVNTDDRANAMAIQSDGKIVLAGDVHGGGTTAVGLARYTTAGALDTHLTTGFGSTVFGTGNQGNSRSGRQLSSHDDYSLSASAMVVTSTGIFVAGHADPTGHNDFLLQRYDNGGTYIEQVITDVAGNGSITGSDAARAIAFADSNRSLVLGGYADIGSNTANNGFALAKFTSPISNDTPMQLVTDFGIGGKVTTPFGQRDAQSNAIALLSDGTIITVGYAHNGGDDDFALAAYNPDGSPDTGFAENGRLVHRLGSGSADRANAMALNDISGSLWIGNVVVAGFTSSDGAVANRDFAVVVYDPTIGSVFSGFGSGSGVATDFDGSADQANAVTWGPEDTVIAAGSAAGSDGVPDFALARYNADGQLDTSFSDDGKVTLPFSVNAAEAFAVAVQPDGKIVVAGYGGNGSDKDFAVARYTTAGELDTTFGEVVNGAVRLGAVTTAIGPADDVAYAMALDGDKILLAGYACVGSDSATCEDEFALVRYTGSGDLDTTFGTGGKVTTDIGDDDEIRALAVRDDGKIVVAGYATNGSEKEFALARYRSDGALDRGFGAAGTGKVTTNCFIGDNAEAYALALQPDAKIVVAGVAANGNNRDSALARYLGQGTLSGDASLSGLSVRDSADGTNFDRAAPLSPSFTSDATAYTAVVRDDATHVQVTPTAGDVRATITVNGQATASGGASGAIPVTPGTTTLTVVVTAEDGASTETYTLSFATVSAFSTDATLPPPAPSTLDTAFSADGKATTDFASNGDEANAVAIQSDGKIVTAGFANDGTDDNFAIARYNTDGTPDTTFSTDGKVTTDFGGNDDQARAVAIQPDGRIVAAGFANDGSDNNFALARYNSNGSLDTTFSSDGKLTTDFAGKDDEAYAVAIQPDGRIVAAGYATNTNSTDNNTTDDHKDFALTRYNSDGSLDESFSNQTKDFGRNDGKVTSLINIYDQEIYAMTIQSDGKIVVAGRSWSGIGNDFAVERYRPNGSRDHTFGFPLQSDVRPGRVTTDFSGTGDYPHAIALQPDGKIVVVGRSWSNGNHNFALVRYTAQGDLDTMFGNGGKVRTHFDADDIAHAVAVLSNGKIIAAGGGGTNFGLARYTANGELDTEFDNRKTGKAVTDFDGNADEARAIAIQSDGKIVVAGYANNGSDTDFAIARYLGDFDFQGAGQNAPVNRAPTVAQPLADVDDLPVGESRRLSLAGVFDYAGFGGLTIFAGSSDEAVVRVAADLDGSSLTLSGESAGTATIRVIAEDPQGERVFDEFDVAVIAPPNSAPTVSSAIADVTIVNESGAREVSLAGVFSDGDGDDLTITASSSDEGVATASVAADHSELTVSAKSRGTATITVTASDGNGGSVEDAFTVTVKAAPSVASAIDDISGLEAEESRTVSLSGVFSDADGDAVTVTDATSSDSAIVAVSVNIDGATSAITGLTVVAKSEGTATITVTAQDSDGNTVQDGFDVTVNAAQQPLQKANNAPTVANDIADATIVNTSGTHEVALSGVFSDADGDALTIKAASSAESVATVAVANDNSSLTVTAKSRGTAVVTVTASDGYGGSVTDTFTVKVKAAPVVATAIPDATMVEVSSKEVDLSKVFSDADADTLTYTVSSTDLDAVAVFEFLGTMTVFAIAEGTETVTVTAQDSDNNQVSDSFTVTVSVPANNPPTVSSAIADATIVNESGAHRVTLSGVFSDADGDDLTFKAASSAESVATVAVSNSSLTVTAKSRGTAVVTVTASDGNGGSVEDRFTVKIKSAPRVASPIADISGLEAEDSRAISLSGVFSDGDGDAVTVTQASSSDSAIAAVSAAIDGSTSAITAITVIAKSEGTATITVTAQDADGNRVSDAFDVTVNAPAAQQQVNNAPTVSAAIADATIVNETGTHRVTLSGVFSDADGDALTVTASSSAESVATVAVSADYSTLTVSAKSRGTATVTVTATDGYGGTIEDAFTVRVKAAPVVASASADVTGLEVGSTQDISLSGVFSDADGDSLTISAASSNEATATVSVASDGSKLTVSGVADGTATVTVTARDADGNTVSDTFDVSVVRAPEPEPEPVELPGPVVNLRLTATDNGVIVSWQPPESGDAPRRYIVHIRPEGGENGSGRTKTPKAKKTKVSFENLEAGRTYKVWVRAENEAGKGERVRAGITIPAAAEDGQTGQ